MLHILKIEILKKMNKNKRICRSCLSENSEMINMFDEYDAINSLLFSEEYICCTNIDIQLHDELPNMICENCLNELNIAYNFRIRSTKSDEFLRRKYEKVNKILDADLIPIHSDTSQDIFVKLENVDENKSKCNLIENNQYVCEERIILDPLNEAGCLLENDAITDEEYKSGNETPLKEDDIKVTLKPTECLICKKQFTSETTLQRHIEKLHQLSKSSFLCNICGKSCLSEKSLKSHLLVHKGEKPFKCDICEKCYFTRNGLRNHQQTHNPHNTPYAKFLCSTCGKGFTTKQRLSVHTLVHTGEKNYPCEICSKTFATEFRLRSHRRTHTGEKPYSCEECGLRFAQGNALRCHKRIHTGEKPYECKICFKKFTQNTILKTHMTLHTGKTVKCPDCDKKFSRASYLILHRREHTGEKPYACEKCPNRYRQKSHLDRHMDIHNGIKYKCDICGKEYTKQWTLKVHMCTHTTNRPFQCSECPMMFTRKDRYKAHQTTHQKSAQTLTKIESLDSDIVKLGINSLTPKDTT